MDIELFNLNELYCAWNIINENYTTPITKKILNLISSYLQESSIILELKEEYHYKINFFKTVDLIIIYQINKLNDIPAYYKGRIIIHSLEKINNNLLKRKGLKVIDKFEHTAVTKYRDIGLFLYHLEGSPWYLKHSDLNCQKLENLHKIFKKNEYIMFAKYFTTIILEK